MTVSSLPSTGFLRDRQIVGDPKANPPIPAIIPIGRSSWWAGVLLEKLSKGGGSEEARDA